MWSSKRSKPCFIWNSIRRRKIRSRLNIIWCSSRWDWALVRNLWCEMEFQCSNWWIRSITTSTLRLIRPRQSKLFQRWKKMCIELRFVWIMPPNFSISMKSVSRHSLSNMILYVRSCTNLWRRNRLSWKEWETRSKWSRTRIRNKLRKWPERSWKFTRQRIRPNLR